MPETKRKLTSTTIDYLCDRCHIGHMRLSLPVHHPRPAFYRHVCDSCRIVKELPTVYPETTFGPSREQYLDDYFDRLAMEISEWSQNTFGTDSERGPIGALKHLEKEAREALENPTDTSEYADCLILVLDASRRAGIHHEDLIKHALAKMEVNRQRTWPKPTTDSPVEHCKEQDGATPLEARHDEKASGEVMMKIAFDIGGVLSKYPDVFRPLINILVLTQSVVEVHVISDMHDKDKMLKMLYSNAIRVPQERVHSADYKTHGEGCKAELCRELGIDILIDDFAGYVSVPDAPPVRLLVMPDVSKPYYHPTWKTDGSEGDFGRTGYYPKRLPHDEREPT